MRQESKIFIATLSLAMVCIIAVSLNSSFAKNEKNDISVKKEKKLEAIRDRNEGVEKFGVLKYEE